MHNEISRRNFIKLVSASGISLALNTSVLSESITTDAKYYKISPIDRTANHNFTANWFGDNPNGAHQILWDRSFQQKPVTEQQVDIAIVGGGISGLVAGYLLKNYKTIILEQASRFGGNSKGRRWQNLDYSIGAAYIVKPAIDTPIYRLLHELKLTDEWQLKADESPVVVNSQLFRSFWNGDTLKSKKDILQLKQLVSYLKSAPYPEIPITKNTDFPYIAKLDLLSLKEHLSNVVKGKLSPHLATAIEHYCWSSFGGSADEISAASGLNFLMAEFDEIAVFPGGNAAIAERLLTKLPADNLSADSLVYKIKVNSNEVNVTYCKNGQTHLIKAKRVIFASPKFILKSVLADIEDERISAINQIKYRSYLVANVMLNERAIENFYDLYLLGNGNTGSVAEADQIKATDVVNANFAYNKKLPYSVLTLYRSLPYDGARAMILAEDSYKKYQEEFTAQVTTKILPLLKIKSSSILNIELTRWGHPLPLASTGLINKKIPQITTKPFKNKVFFIHQDNWQLPAFETGVTEALYWVPKVIKSLTT
jgi:protoporphyrinogen oxidase